MIICKRKGSIVYSQDDVNVEMIDILSLKFYRMFWTFSTWNYDMGKMFCLVDNNYPII